MDFLSFEKGNFGSPDRIKSKKVFHATALLVAFSLLLSALFGLVACSPTSEAVKELSEKDKAAVLLAATAAETQNGTRLSERDFMLSIALDGAEETLFFAQGTAIRETSDTNPLMSGKMTQIRDGSASTFDIYYKAGAYYTAKGESKFYTVINKDVFTKQFVFAAVPVPSPDCVSKVETAESSEGTIYRFWADPLCFTEELKGLLGDDLYTICKLKKAQKDKTAYGTLVLEYLIDSKGSLKTFNLKCPVTLQDTPPYLPGQAAEESDYVKTFDLSFTVSVKSTGDDLSVTLPTTSEFTLIR